MESSKVSNTGNGAKVIPLLHQNNNQSNYILSNENEGLTETTELPESPSTGTNKQRITTALDSTPSGIGSTHSSLDRPDTALVESKRLGELTARTT
ncbi:hypothetical protein ACH5RR_012896 [Cinchona calisaya]|uniref:Uncharacterized protein n=1 Tax=Cinchona calisaya TaxID=153742 RepID=A0ABD3ACQ2_9GENT